MANPWIRRSGVALPAPDLSQAVFDILLPRRSAAAEIDGLVNNQFRHLLLLLEIIVPIKRSACINRRLNEVQGGDAVLVFRPALERALSSRVGLRVIGLLVERVDAGNDP
ncbi:MAG: hypothetical protein P4M05_05105 [Bradyrhizobium sp.]|nr:hypothetical protein [Bradyrhizobium sp.]